MFGKETVGSNFDSGILLLQELTPSENLLNGYSALIAGGGAPEIHVSRLLSQYSQTLKGMEAYCFAAYAEALEVIPTTLAENAGLNPIAMVTELRNRHALGERSAGINVRKVRFIYRSSSGSCVWFSVLNYMMMKNRE